MIEIKRVLHSQESPSGESVAVSNRQRQDAGDRRQPDVSCSLGPSGTAFEDDASCFAHLIGVLVTVRPSDTVDTSSGLPRKRVIVFTDSPFCG